MGYITVVLAILLLGMLSVSIWLATQLRKCRAQPRKDKPDPQTILVEYVSPLIRDDDPLGNIVKFNWHYAHGQASPSQASAACRILVQTLQESWGLQEFVRYRETVPFDKKLHRVDRSSQIAPGSPVSVIEPGWKLNNTIIKYPLVKPVVSNEAR